MLSKIINGNRNVTNLFETNSEIDKYTGKYTYKSNPPPTPPKTSPEKPVKKYPEMLPRGISSPVKPISLIKIPEKNLESTYESGFSFINNSMDMEEDESLKEVKTTVDNIINSGRLDDDDDDCDNKNLNYDNFKMKLKQKRLPNSSIEKVLSRKRGCPGKGKYVNIDTMYNHY